MIKSCIYQFHLVYKIQELTKKEIKRIKKK